MRGCKCLFVMSGSCFYSRTSDRIVFMSYQKDILRYPDFILDFIIKFRECTVILFMFCQSAIAEDSRIVFVFYPNSER